jgi:hypothetical protein
VFEAAGGPKVIGGEIRSTYRLHACTLRVACLLDERSEKLRSDVISCVVGVYCDLNDLGEVGLPGQGETADQVSDRIFPFYGYQDVAGFDVSDYCLVTQKADLVAELSLQRANPRPVGFSGVADCCLHVLTPLSVVFGVSEWVVGWVVHLTREVLRYWLCPGARQELSDGAAGGFRISVDDDVADAETPGEGVVYAYLPSFYMVIYCWHWGFLGVVRSCPWRFSSAVGRVLYLR